MTEQLCQFEWDRRIVKRAVACGATISISICMRSAVFGVQWKQNQLTIFLTQATIGIRISFGLRSSFPCFPNRLRCQRISEAKQSTIFIRNPTSSIDVHFYAIDWQRSERQRFGAYGRLLTYV